MTKKIKKEPTLQDVVVKIDDVMDKLASLDRKFDGLENKLQAFQEETAEFFTSSKKDFDRLEQKVDGIDVRLSDVEVACTQNTRAIQSLDEKFTGRFDDLEGRVYQDLNAISKTLVKYDRIFARLALA